MGAVVRGADLREHELHGQGVPQVKSGPPGTRTQNQRIKGPLLCQLS